MTFKTAKNADTPKRESFLMECVVKPIVKKLSGLLVTVLVVIAIATYVGKLIPSLFPQEVTISEVVIEEKLQALGELVTAEHTKSGVKTWGASRKLPVVGWTILGTYNELNLEYTSTIMVGYDFSAIKPVKVDDHTIRITLPEAQVLGAFLETSESTDISLFNRIPDDTVAELKAEVRAQAMEDAVNAGIYEMAEEEAKAQITDILSEVGDFKIEFE